MKHGLGAPKISLQRPPTGNNFLPKSPQQVQRPKLENKFLDKRGSQKKQIISADFSLKNAMTKVKDEQKNFRNSYRIANSRNNS